MNFKPQHFLPRLCLLFKLYILQYEDKVRELTQHNSHNPLLVYTYFNSENNEKFKSLHLSIGNYFTNLFCHLGAHSNFFYYHNFGILNDQFLKITNLTHNYFFVYIYSNSLHVSSTPVLIITTINCINTTSGICHSENK
jgi:hypothetical protein